MANPDYINGNYPKKTRQDDIALIIALLIPVVILVFLAVLHFVSPSSPSQPPCSGYYQGDEYIQDC